VQSIARFAEENKIPMVQFLKGQRKEDVAAEMRTQSEVTDGVVFIGKAQKKMQRVSHRKAAQPENRANLRLDRQVDGAGKSLLLLLRR
jgi:hypothetical protein